MGTATLGMAVAGDVGVRTLVSICECAPTEGYYLQTTCGGAHGDSEEFFLTVRRFCKDREFLPATSAFTKTYPGIGA
jgi:hypothetical protein